MQNHAADRADDVDPQLQQPVPQPRHLAAGARSTRRPQSQFLHEHVGRGGQEDAQLVRREQTAARAVDLQPIEQFRLSSNGCGWVEARSAGRRGVLAARVASELTAHGVHLTGGGRGAPWPGVGRSGVAAGRTACQRATRVLRCATALRVTHRPSLRSSSRYGPCGPAWTGASRPPTTTRKARQRGKRDGWRFGDRRWLIAQRPPRVPAPAADARWAGPRCCRGRVRRLAGRKRLQTQGASWSHGRVPPRPARRRAPCV